MLKNLIYLWNSFIARFQISEFSLTRKEARLLGIFLTRNFYAIEINSNEDIDLKKVGKYFDVLKYDIADREFPDSFRVVPTRRVKDFLNGWNVGQTTPWDPGVAAGPCIESKSLTRFWPSSTTSDQINTLAKYPNKRVRLL